MTWNGLIINQIVNPNVLWPKVWVCLQNLDASLFQILLDVLLSFFLGLKKSFFVPLRQATLATEKRPQQTNKQKVIEMWSDMPPNESDTRDKPEAGALFAWGFSIKNAWFWQQLAFTCLRLFMEFGHWKCQEYLGVTWNWNCFRWCHVWNLCIVQRICLVLGSRYGTHFLDKVWQRPNIVWKRQFILSKSLYPENIRMGPTLHFQN